MKIQPHHRRREFGFSLVEIVVALAIVGVMIAISVPSIDSIRKEKLAREPVTALAKMVRETRKRAMSEGRPYQIAFDSRGFHTARFFSPYGKSEEFDQLQRDLEVIAQEQEIIEASRARGIDLNAGAGPTEAQQQMEVAREGMTYFEKVELPDTYSYKLRFYGDTDWVDMTTGEFKRWVFQPSGMLDPMQIQVQSDNAFFEVEFHPLTGDVKSESGWVE